MKFLRIFLVCVTFSLPCFAGKTWPPSETNHWEIVDLTSLRLLLPLPDFAFSEENNSSAIYAHTVYPHRVLFLTVDPFNPNENSLDLSEYENWFSQSWKADDSSIKVVYEKKFLSGENGNLPIIRKLWQCEDGTYHQLYFVDKTNGFCITCPCLPPAGSSQEIIEHEIQYWEKLLDDLGQVIAFEDYDDED